jgi:beta-glucosidase
MNTSTRRRFPAGFLWGAATASYQIEGATEEDGRGESIWDRFSRVAGAVRNGETGNVACDFYHRYRDDIAHMHALGLDAFRFSIAWPRILPAGTGEVNGAGLDFYDRLIDELLRHDIQPMVTLYHWDLPQALEDRGGWTSRETAEAFAAYTEIVTRRLGDRVKYWITHNEPQVAAFAGYGGGRHAPGKTGQANALSAAHHLLLSHGLAVPIIRRESPGAQVGITLNLSHVDAATDGERDRAAASYADARSNRWFADPVLRGSYPSEVLDRVYAEMPEVQSGDLATMAAPIDFLGVNNYFRNVVRADPETGEPRTVRPDDAALTEMGWEVYPQGMYDLLTHLQREYALDAIYVTENGAAFADIVDHQGQVKDPERQRYIEGYLDSVLRAIEDGVPVKGYFYWTLLDNFEWAHGYSKRFGLIHVHYPTLHRTPKGSYYWYRDFISAQKAGR